mgnify:CR=1 FL=1
MAYRITIEELYPFESDPGPRDSDWLYQQTLESLDVQALIIWINNLPPKRKHRKKSEGMV